MKPCTQCGGERDTKGAWCKACRAAAMRAYRATPEGKAATRRMESNRVVTDERRAQKAMLQKAWAQTPEGKATLAQASKTYRAKHREKVNAGERKRRAANPMFKLTANLRRRTREVMSKGGYTKTATIAAVLGCTFDELKAHIERQFTPGMSWVNFGEWEIDHIVPLASAKDASELFALGHYTNLQPLWAAYNKLKQDLLPDQWAAYIERSQIDITVKPLGKPNVARSV